MHQELFSRLICDPIQSRGKQLNQEEFSQTMAIMRKQQPELLDALEHAALSTTPFSPVTGLSDVISKIKRKNKEATTAVYLRYDWLSAADEDDALFEALDKLRDTQKKRHREFRAVRAQTLKSHPVLSVKRSFLSGGFLL